MFSTFAGGMTDMYRPMYPGQFTLGADPFRFRNQQEERIGKELKKTAGLSDGGIAVLWNYDASIDANKKMSDWESYKFVLTYRYRTSNTDEYNEDVLKAAIYYGAMVYPETNVPTTYEYFIRHKFGGYLIYDIDANGKMKDKPGSDTLDSNKQEIFTLWRDYIDFRCHKEDHVDLLMELKTIRRTDQMRHFDLLVAGGMALKGAKSPYSGIISRVEEHDYDYNDFIWT